jgi:hypothetical protein
MRTAPLGILLEAYKAPLTVVPVPLIGAAAEILTLRWLYVAHGRGARACGVAVARRASLSDGARP